MTRFGDFSPLCSQTPSYPWCNLFFAQLLKTSPSVLTGVSSDSNSAPVGVNPQCGIPKVGSGGSLGNIANIIACVLSIGVVAVLIYFTGRRKAAVGRVEIRIFFVLYLLTLPLQLISTGSLLAQGSKALVAITAIHAGAIAALFWALLANALVASQVVEDGTLSSLVPFIIFTILFFASTTYIAADVGFSLTKTLGTSTPPSSLHSIPLFILTSIWPGASVLLYFGTMTYIVVIVLNEIRPMWYYILSFALFVLSQLDYFLLSKFICKGTSARLDGSFIATILETTSIGVLFLAWRSITEESWEDDAYYS
jgi:hypothetical protein